MSSPIDLYHALHRLATDRTAVHLPSADETRAHVPAVVEQRVLLCAVADLTHVHVLIGNLPVADALPVSPTMLVAANVFVPGLVFDKRSLSIAFVRHPVSIVCITIWVQHSSLAMTSPQDKVALVDRRLVGDMFAFAVILPFAEFAAVPVASKRGLDGLETSEAGYGMTAPFGP